LFDILVFIADLPLLLAQEGGGAAPPAGGAGDGVGGSIFGSMMFPLMITLLLMYFLLMRPEQRKKKDLEKKLSEIKKDDHVVTIGGIAGTVVLAEPDSKFVTVRIDDKTGTKVKVLRTAISFIGPTDEPESGAKAGD
jgi:preprotein translocase subunit YajC